MPADRLPLPRLPQRFLQTTTLSPAPTPSTPPSPAQSPAMPEPRPNCKLRGISTASLLMAVETSRSLPRVRRFLVMSTLLAALTSSLVHQNLVHSRALSVQTGECYIKSPPPLSMRVSPAPLAR